MSARVRRIAARLALAMLGAALGTSIAHAAPGDMPATGIADGAGAATAGAPAARNKPTLRESPGKPAAPIAVAYVLATQPALGVPFDVQISARGGDGIADLALSVQPGNGVEAGTPQRTASSADGAQRSWTVAATAYRDGTLYLGLLVQGTAGDQHPARNLLIPIRIGAAATAEETASPQSAPGPAGQRVIVLPAAGAR